MKINLVYSGITCVNGADYVAIFCKNALEKLGHEVFEVGGMAQPLTADSQFNKEADFNLAILGYGIPNSLITKLKSYAPTVLWTQNDEMPMHLVNSKRLSPFVDLYCSYTRYKLDEFGSNALYLPIGADDTLFYPLTSAVYKYDIAIVGWGHTERIRIVDELKKKLHDYRWFLNFDMRLPFESLNEVYNSTKVVIAPFMDCDQGVLSTAFGCPCRTFDVPATKAFQLQLDREGLWDVYTKDEVVAIPTKDIDTWAEAILYYLEHEDERNMYRERAYKRTIETNLYQHRMQAVIDKLKELGKLK